MSRSYSELSDDDLGMVIDLEDGIPDCRICRDDEKAEALISPCACSGSVSLVHPSCLEQWVQTRQQSNGGPRISLRCEICHSDYACAVENQMQSSKICTLASCAQLCNAALMVCMLILTGISIGLTYPSIKKDMKENPSSAYVLWIFAVITFVMFVITCRTLYRRWIGAVSSETLVFQDQAIITGTDPNNQTEMVQQIQTEEHVI